MMKQDTKMKEQFKDRLQAWSQLKLGVRFDTLSHVQQSRQMIGYFVQEVLERLNPGIVPEDEGEVESSIVDGSGDGGADLVYRTDDGQVLIIQAKYRGNNAHESAESVGRVCDFLQRLYISTLGKQKGLHNDLLDLASQIDWNEDYFRVYFITTARTGESVRDRVIQGLGHVPELPSIIDRSELHYFDQSLLNQAVREAISSSAFSAKPIAITMSPDSNGNPWCHFETESRDLYIGEVSGAILAQTLQEHRASLFTMNIRDYVGDSKTNKQIIQTALKAPTNFEYFNNGVTAVAGSISADLERRTLTCEKMSIINGAQTVKSLLLALGRREDASQHKPVSSVRVLFRLMSFRFPEETPFVNEVTRFNNTQNAIKIADFRSNDEVQKDLARRFRNLNLAGKPYQYKNKRSPKVKNSIAITLEEFMKALFAFRFGPDDVWGGTSKLFDASATGLYLKVFDHPDTTLSENEFNVAAGTFFGCDFIKGVWDENRKLLRVQKISMHPALERKGLIFFAVGELERQSYQQQKLNLEHDLARLAKPSAWLPDAHSAVKDALTKAFQIASKILCQQYDLKKASDPGFKHRNWFRDQETLEGIRKGVAMALDFGVPPRIWS